jgi:hypothetical protein
MVAASRVQPGIMREIPYDLTFYATVYSSVEVHFPAGIFGMPFAGLTDALSFLCLAFFVIQYLHLSLRVMKYNVI